MVLNTTVKEVTDRIIAKSKPTRDAYLLRMSAQFGKRVKRSMLGCTNLAHACAAEDSKTKITLAKLEEPNIAIVSAYNDMLSAHHPYATYPQQIKDAVASIGATAQVAGGVPAMCDGITQSQAGMELSLFSRDVIALSTAVSLSHNVFDGVICLGICDKIVPGLLIGALSFGYLPTIFIPSGPMGSGISNQEKAYTRKLYAEGKVGMDALMDSEMKSYHSSGTCTFYGTANSNQMLMEIMGLHVPGSAFVPPFADLRPQLTKFASIQAVKNTKVFNQGSNFTPLCDIVNEKSIVNAIVGLIATGGSTNHTIHIVAIARACGIIIDWDDFHDLSSVVPLLSRVYPNGVADVNQFHNAGGVAYVISELLDAGLLHNDVKTVVGVGLDQYRSNPTLDANNNVVWNKAVNLDDSILSSYQKPFSKDGGVKLITGNLGRSVSKISAIAPEHRYVKAEACVFSSQDDVVLAYKNGELNKDCVVVLCFQGPKANGMPELHGLTPALTSLQDQGYKVALVTDGRMSGASGKVPNAIHVTPEALNSNSYISKIQNGDIIELDLTRGTLNIITDDVNAFYAREGSIISDNNNYGLGRELFGLFRHNVSSAELGASSIIGL